MTNNDQLPGTLVPVGLSGTQYSYSIRIPVYGYQVPEASANTQENVACLSCVAGVGLENLTNRAIRTDVSI